MKPAHPPKIPTTEPPAFVPVLPPEGLDILIELVARRAVAALRAREASRRSDLGEQS